MRFGIGGTKTLAVRKRRTGETQRVPVIPVEYDGDRYIVSTRGDSDWVRNLRAADEAELRAGDSTERIQAAEVPAAERAPILAAYRKVAGKTVESYFKKLPDPEDHPVFRIEPR
jgi:deazaflavin-dependent oxidoreductase (nitroreductase family)